MKHLNKTREDHCVRRFLPSLRLHGVERDSASCDRTPDISLTLNPKLNPKPYVLNSSLHAGCFVWS